MNRILVVGIARVVGVAAALLVEQVAGAQAEPAAAGSTQAGAGLTAARAVARAIDHSPQLRVEQEVIATERAGEAEAKVGWYPRLTLTAGYTRNSPYSQPILGPFVAAPGIDSGPVPPTAPLVSVGGQFPAFINTYLLQAQLVVPITDYILRTRMQANAASASTRAAQHQADAARSGVAREVVLLYYAWARAELARGVAEQTLDSARVQLAATRDLLELGKVTQSDLLSAQARAASAERLLTQATAQHQRLENDLRLVIAASAQESLARAEDLSQPLPPEQLADLPALRAEAEQARFELRAQTAAAQSLDHSASASVATGLPRLDLVANATYANPNWRYLPPEEAWHGTWDIGAQLTWVPNDLASATTHAARIEAQRRRVLAEEAVIRDALAREVHEAVAAVQEADGAVAPSEAELAAAEEADRGRREAYALGKSTLVDVQAAQSALVIARLSRLDALIAQRTSRAMLAHALGRPVAAGP
jgi:outer membrane protein